MNREKWAECKLGDVCTLLNGRAYKQDELLSEGKWPVLRVGNLFSRNSWYYSDLELEADKFIDNGDLIYAWSASFGPRIWDGPKVIYHYHIWKCLLDPRLVDKKYLYNLLLWDTAAIKGDHGVGSTMMHVTKGSMEQRKIPLPPIAEQQRIVRKLDALSARSARARTHLAAIEKLVERYKASFTSLLFKRLETEYGKIQLGSVCNRITKGASPNWQGFEYTKSGVIFVRSQNVLWGYTELNDVAFVPIEFNEKQRNSVMQLHDVLLNIVGASIGRAAVVSPDLVGSNCNQAVAVIRLAEPDETDAQYLCKWLTAPNAQAQIMENAVDVARANFSLGQAKALQMPWPPKHIRKQTVKIIEGAFAKIDRLAAEAAKALQLTDRLDQRILAKAFAGELVPQDPNDEPASALLDRIRAERAAAPKAKRTRRTA